jgi:hypothetical protein
MFSVAPAAKRIAGYTDFDRDQRIARIELRRAFIRRERLFPFAATAVNRCIEALRVRVVWLEFDDPVEFS